MSSRAANKLNRAMLRLKYHLGGGAYGERMNKNTSEEAKDMAGHPIKAGKAMLKAMMSRFY